jgi:hypothetical protein
MQERGQEASIGRVGRDPTSNPLRLDISSQGTPNEKKRKKKKDIPVIKTEKSFSATPLPQFSRITF